MAQQAMAIGRPCIAVKFGGHAEFLSDEVAYCANFKLVPARYNYSGGGIWAEPEREHVIELMRRVYRNRAEARRLGERASKIAAQYSWERSNRALAEILYEVGLAKVKPR